MHEENPVPESLGKRTTGLVLTAIFLVLLMLAIFSTGELVWDLGFSFYRIWGGVFAILGFLILYFYSFKNPNSFYGHCLAARKQLSSRRLLDRGIRSSGGSYRILIEETLGTGFIVGGMTYTITRDINYVIGALALSVWLMRLEKYRTED